MSDLRININGRNDHNTITEKDYPEPGGASASLKPTGGSLASKNVRIVFEPSAVAILFESIGWGRAYRRGDVEQGGILIGNYYLCRKTGEDVIWGDVVVVVPADPALVNASFKTIDITTAAWEKMYEDAGGYRAENLQILGWYHTHLGDMSTRFSNLDRITQKKAFTYEYSFGVVFNPNQGKWSAFYGPDSRECVGDLLFDEALSARYGRPQITIRQVNGDSELQEDGYVVHLDEAGAAADLCSERRRAAEMPRSRTISGRQLIGRFFSGVGQLLMKPETGGETRNAMIHGHNANSASERHEEAYAPKIKIRSIRHRPSMIKCASCSVTEDNRFVERLDFECTVKNDVQKAILGYRRRGPGNYQRYGPLWGKVRQHGSKVELLLAGSEKKANALIIFSENNADSAENRNQVRGYRRTSKAGIGFIVLVSNAGSPSVDVRVIPSR